MRAQVKPQVGSGADADTHIVAGYLNPNLPIIDNWLQARRPCRWRQDIKAVRNSVRGRDAELAHERVADNSAWDHDKLHNKLTFAERGSVRHVKHESCEAKKKCSHLELVFFPRIE